MAINLCTEDRFPFCPFVQLYQTIIAASSINSIYFGVYRVSLERIMELGNEDRLFRFEADHQWKNQVKEFMPELQ